MQKVCLLTQEKVGSGRLSRSKTLQALPTTV